MPERRPDTHIGCVFDINVFIGAVVGGNSPFRTWPSPPPVSDNLFADCIGVANDAREVALYVSEQVLTNVARVLQEVLGWREHLMEEYVELIVEIAQASGVGLVEPGTRVSDCVDDEDNRVLELALAADATLIVSDDVDLTSMSPWRGIPVIRPAEFAKRIDVRRARNSRPHIPRPR